MNRRELLQTSAALAISAIAASASAEGDAMPAHDHAAMMKYQGLVDSTGNCVAKGEACLAHCLVLLGEGDKSMAACSKAVNQMLALCGALQKLAAQNSPLTPALAKVALDGCSDCQKECEAHASMHAQCKACFDACGECIKQCKAIAA